MEIDHTDNDWPVVPLDQLVDDSRGITYGIVQPGDAVVDGVPIVRVNNIRNGRITTDDVMRVARSIEAKYSRTRLRGGEILLTLVGSLGHCAIVPPELKGWNVARAVGVIPVRDDVDARWVKFCLESAAVQHFVGSRANTTVQATLNLRDVNQLPIPLPPIEEQQRIAHILGTLDDKIELNRRMNATLEAMARALFQSWFVDFDPVRVKAAGRTPAGMDPATAALFPSEFEDSKLGEIPKAWAYDSVYKIADVHYGAPFASSQFNENAVGKPLLRIRDLKDEKPAIWTPEIHPKGRTIGPGDIVVGMDGEFRAYLWGGEEVWLNQRLCTFVPKGGHSTPFVINSIARPLAEVEASETATTVIHLGKNDIDRFRVVSPSAQIAIRFGDLCQPLFDKIIANKQMNRSLEAVRDALLPRLLSGENVSAVL